MFNRLIYTALLAPMLLVSTPASAQTHMCGTSVADQALMKDRMLENRRNRAELMERATHRNGLVYIPVQYHVAGTTAGEYHHPITEVYNSLCKINEDFTTMGLSIRFYMNGPVRIINNDLLYDHAPESNDPTAQYFMSLFKEPGMPNIFVGRWNQAGDEMGAYYTSLHDVIYTFKNGVNSSSSTLTHELGHYFTLPHTFFGWENTAYNDMAIDNKAPDLPWVEKVARPGQGVSENCQFAADGFCDTPADYNSGWYNSCNFNMPAIRDQDSVTIAPDEGNIMSYFPGACNDSFSTEQQNAVLLDVYNRGYDLFPDPSPMTVDGPPVLEFPTQTQPALYYDMVNFRWQEAPGALLYLIEVYDDLFGSPTNLVAYQQVHEPQAWIALEANKTYHWRVTPTNQIDACNSHQTAFEQFNTGNWAVSVEELQASVLNSRIIPNPAQTSQEVLLEIETEDFGQAVISIVNSLGQSVMARQTIDLLPGTNHQNLDLSALGAGMYIVNIETNEGRISHKLILEE